MSIKAEEVLLARLHPEGAVEQVVRRLGEAVGAGLLAPGERLPPEPELAARLGVAPMTLRSALAILRDAGVVETRRGRNGGSFVRAVRAKMPGDAPPSAEALRELTDWRRAVSGEAAALAAARAHGDDVGLLRKAARAVEDGVADAVAYRLADARFHVAVAEVSRSRRLVAAETQLQAELTDALRLTQGPPSARRVSQAAHAELVAAIAAGDAEAARDVTVRHAEATYDWIAGLLLGRLGR